MYLVTGAAGFIGFHTAKALLLRGEEVLGLDNLNDYYDVKLKKARLEILANYKSFKFIKADIAKESDLKKISKEYGNEIEIIIHLAAQAGVRYSLTNPEAYIESNLKGHVNMLEMAKNMRNLKHFIYASSSSVYGASKKIPFALSDRADKPLNLYGATKRANEHLSHSYAEIYKMNLTGLRFFTVYGLYGRPDMAYFSFTKNILEGKPIKLFNHGKMKRDFTYIDDIVSGILACTSKFSGIKNAHRVYNLGNSQAEKLMDMVTILEKACKKKAVIKYLPMQPGEMLETFADIKESQKDFGFKPKIKISSGLPQFVEWYKNFYH